MSTNAVESQTQNEANYLVALPPEQRTWHVVCAKYLPIIMNSHVVPPCTWSNGLPLLRADFRNPAGSPHQDSMFQALRAEHGPETG